MATIKGITIAILNVFVIAFGIGFAEHDLTIAPFVVVFSGVPAVVVGALIGLFAGLTATRSPWWRAVLLSLPAFALVVILASIFGLSARIPVACIPTLVAALMLERWTRRVAPAPPVPVAWTMHR